MMRIELIDTMNFFDILKKSMLLKFSWILCVVLSNFLFFNHLNAAGFMLDIFVPRVSKFQLIQYHKKIQHGDNIIGQFVLENNTIDGFKLEILSPKSGVLSPETTNDGDISIPYTLYLEKRTGTVASNVVVDTTPDLTLGVPINVIDSYGAQNDKTEVVYNVHLTIDDPDNLLLMAGLYKESISFVYTDY